VTAVVRCDLLIPGPDVAPMWPHRSRAWKALPRGRPLLLRRRTTRSEAIPDVNRPGFTGGLVP
jgi:hypothetical protein